MLLVFPGVQHYFKRAGKVNSFCVAVLLPSIQMMYDQSIFFSKLCSSSRKQSERWCTLYSTKNNTKPQRKSPLSTPHFSERQELNIFLLPPGSALDLETVRPQSGLCSHQRSQPNWCLSHLAPRRTHTTRHVTQQ